MRKLFAIGFVVLWTGLLAGGAEPPVEIPNARMFTEEILVGGQPTEEQIRELAALGYRTIVSTRTEGERGSWDEASLAGELGLRFVLIPMAGADGLTEENALRLAEVLEGEDAYPMMVHCGSGNRVGALFALKAFYVDGVELEAAMEIGDEAGMTRLEPAVREHLVAAVED